MWYRASFQVRSQRKVPQKRARHETRSILPQVLKPKTRAYRVHASCVVKHESLNAERRFWTRWHAGWRTTQQGTRRRLGASEKDTATCTRNRHRLRPDTAILGVAGCRSSSRNRRRESNNKRFSGDWNCALGELFVPNRLELEKPGGWFDHAARAPALAARSASSPTRGPARLVTSSAPNAA